MRYKTWVEIPKPNGKGTDSVRAVVYVKELPPTLKRARTVPIAGRA